MKFQMKKLINGFSKELNILDKDEYYYFTGSGNALVHIYRFDGDKEYYVVVSKDYESGEIEFEEEDYA